MAKRILVVDDQPDMLRRIQDILELAAYEVITVTDDVGAIRMIEAERPDCVVAEIMHSFGVLNWSRLTGRIPDLLVVTFDKSGTSSAVGSYGVTRNEPFRPSTIVPYLAWLFAQLAEEQEVKTEV